MHKSGLAERNLRLNRESQKKLRQGEMICGQGLGAISQLHYGLCRMSFNGCSCIAVYNALVYFGKMQPLADVVFYMERFRVLAGFLGCRTSRIGRALSHFGAAFIPGGNAEKAEAFIICFWTGKPFLSTLHTVFCVRKENEISVYNRYNNSSAVHRYKAVQELTKGRKPVSVYVLK